jgi:tripartite-type tricarboxylate transporter receptor subunit TctC
MNPDLVTKINTAVNAALQDKDIIERFARLGGEPASGTALGFTAMVKADREAWRKVIAERKITGD